MVVLCLVVELQASNTERLSKMKVCLKKWVSLSLGLLISCHGLAQENTLGLPATISLSAYDVGSSGYNQAVAIGNAFKQKYGSVNLRVLPGKNDVSRNMPLRAGKVDFSINGIGGSFLAQEGVFEFGDKQWGPQPVRIIMFNSVTDQALTAIVAGDIGVKTPADLKGKRAAWVIGAPSLNQNLEAILAFGGLTWDDVQKVEFGGYGAAFEGVINGQADMVFGSANAGKAFALAKSPRGVVYPEMDRGDKEGWARVKSIAPYMYPVSASSGADLSIDNKVDTAAYPYPILMTYVNQDKELVRKVMLGMIETYDLYKDTAPGNAGWSLSGQKLDWLVPFHEGAIDVYRDKGLWTQEHQKHNDALIKRQEILAKAWQEVNSRAHKNEGEFQKDWMSTRAKSLRSAGFDVFVESWQ